MSYLMLMYFMNGCSTIMKIRILFILHWEILIKSSKFQHLLIVESGKEWNFIITDVKKDMFKPKKDGSL